LKCRLRTASISESSISGGKLTIPMIGTFTRFGSWYWGSRIGVPLSSKYVGPPEVNGVLYFSANVLRFAPASLCADARDAAVTQAAKTNHVAAATRKRRFSPRRQFTRIGYRVSRSPKRQPSGRSIQPRGRFREIIRL
jgi:hypothetical protein